LKLKWYKYGFFLKGASKLVLGTTFKRFPQLRPSIT